MHMVCVCLRPAYHRQVYATQHLVLVITLLTQSVSAATVQAGALCALPQLDLETAQDLRRRQSSHAETSSSGMDETPPLQQMQSSSALLRQSGSSDSQHVLLRPKKSELGRCDSAMSLDEDNFVSIWDSYDADEEAAVLAMSSAQSFRNKGRSIANPIEGQRWQQHSRQPHSQHSQEGSSFTAEATSGHLPRPAAHDNGRDLGEDSFSSSTVSPQSEQKQTLIKRDDQVELEDNAISDGAGSASSSWARRTEEDLSPVSPFYM